MFLAADDVKILKHWGHAKIRIDYNDWPDNLKILPLTPIHHPTPPPKPLKRKYLGRLL